MGAGSPPDAELAATLLESHPLNPFRPLNWRWRLAGPLARHDRRLRHKWIDAPVRQAAHHLRQAAREGRASTNRPSRLDPALATAIRLQKDDSPRRREVVCRLLAGQADAAVAAACGLEPAVVAAFEATFFSVRDRLDAVDHLALALRADEPGPTATLGLLSYRGGPLVAELLCGPAPDPQLARCIEMLDIVRGITPTPRTAPRVLLLHERLRELEALRAGRVEPALADAAVMLRAVLADGLPQAAEQDARNGADERCVEGLQGMAAPRPAA
jgi:hypothetical protein